MPSPEEQAVAILRAEVSRLNSLIELMTKGTPGRRGGRRGKQDMPIALSVSVPRKRGVRTWTAAQKRAQSERARLMWLGKKKKTGKKKAAATAK